MSFVNRLPEDECCDIIGQSFEDFIDTSSFAQHTLIQDTEVAGRASTNMARMGKPRPSIKTEEDTLYSTTASDIQEFPDTKSASATSSMSAFLDRLRANREAYKNKQERNNTSEQKMLTGHIFKFLPDELKFRITKDMRVSLDFLPPIPPKPRPLIPPRIPVGILHDGAAVYEAKGGKTYVRAGRLVFMSAKEPNNSVYLSGEFGEMVAAAEMICVIGYETPKKRADQLARIMFEHDKAVREQDAAFKAEVREWIRLRRQWEFDTVSMLYLDYKSVLTLPTDEDRVIEAFHEWSWIGDSVQGRPIHKSIQDIDSMVEFDIIDDADTSAATKVNSNDETTASNLISWGTSGPGPEPRHQHLKSLGLQRQYPRRGSLQRKTTTRRITRMRRLLKPDPIKPTTRTIPFFILLLENLDLQANRSTTLS